MTWLASGGSSAIPPPAGPPDPGLIEQMQVELNTLAEELAMLEAANGSPAVEQRVFVPAERVDGVLDAIRAELQAKAEELSSLEDAAAAAEASQPVADKGEEVFADVEAAIESMRGIAELEVALVVDHALARAAALLAAADAEAEWIRAAARSGPGAGPSPPRPSPPRPSVPRPSPPRSFRPLEYRPVLVPDRAPPPPPQPAPARVAATPMPAAAAPMPPRLVEPEPPVPPAPAEPEPSDPVTSWEAASAVRISEEPVTAAIPGAAGRKAAVARPRLSPIPLDAVLPMLALLMLLGIVLVWMG